MASKNNINSVFTDIANSIRAKKGTTNTIQPINMAEEIDGIPTGIIPSGKIEITNTEEINVTNYETAQVVDSNLIPGNIKKGEVVLGVPGTYEGDTTQEDGLVTGEITSYSNDRVTKVRNHAFYECKKLSSVNIPNATSIGDSAFSNCFKLASIDAPKAISIDQVAFTYCYGLTSISFPNVTSIASQAFYYCQNLKNVSLPQVSSLGYAVFKNCYSLIKLVITQTNEICYLDSDVFRNCYHFSGTVNNSYNPQGLKDGRIYVPDELVDSYKSYTNWSAYADIIVPLSTLVE